MKRSLLLTLVLILSAGAAQAAKIHCRGVDANKEQIAIDINDITRAEDNNIYGSVKFRTLKLMWAKDICKSATLKGADGRGKIDVNILVECDSLNAANQAQFPGFYAMQLKITSRNQYKAQLCHGQGTEQDHSIAGVAFKDQTCLELRCSTYDDLDKM